MIKSNFILTQDGSWTLKQRNNLAHAQAMHSLDGALAETFYVYGHAVELLIKLHYKSSASQISPLRCMVFGLGLGYIELLLAGLMASTKTHIQISSFESDPNLAKYFVDWIEKKNVPTDFFKAYQDAICKVETEFCLTQNQSRETLAHLLATDHWKINGAFNEQTQVEDLFDCILYDPYSPSVSPELWSAQFLEKMIQEVCQPNCLFASYACNGVLKKTLKSQEFKLIKRPGFGRKRESTLAQRGFAFSESTC